MPLVFFIGYYMGLTRESRRLCFFLHDSPNLIPLDLLFILSVHASSHKINVNYLRTASARFTYCFEHKIFVHAE